MTGHITDFTAAGTLTGAELLEVSQLSTTVAKTATTLSALASDNSFNDSGAGFITAGFAVGDRVNVAGFTGNVANNIAVGVITALTAGKMTIGGTDGDVIVDDAAGESVTIAKWTTRRTTAALLAAASAVTVDNDTTLASDSTTSAATVHAVRGYVATAVTGLLEWKGATDCSANPNYPAASKGDAYTVSVAGKIGGASGSSVDVGDVFIATADNAGGTQASVGASWVILEHNLVSALSASLASAAEVQAGSSTSKVVTPGAMADAAQPQTLTDGATVNWDMSAGYNAKVTLGGNRTLAVSNPKLGWTYSLNVIQDGTGSRTMTWPSSFDWGTTGAPTLTTTASKRDRITLFCTDASTPKFDAFLSGKGFS